MNQVITNRHVLTFSTQTILSIAYYNSAKLNANGNFHHHLMIINVNDVSSFWQDSSSAVMPLEHATDKIFLLIIVEF